MFSTASNHIANNAETKTASRPYVVVEIAPSGTQIDYFSGVSSATDPFDIAIDLGAKPFSEDKYLAFPEIKMGIGSQITLYRAPDYTVDDGKRSKTVRSWAANIGGVLADGNILELGADDKINFSLDTKAESGMGTKEESKI